MDKAAVIEALGGLEQDPGMDDGAGASLDCDDEDNDEGIMSQWWFGDTDNAEPGMGYVADVEDESDVLEQLREEIGRQR